MKPPIGESFSTGDLNLASAIMTMGVPPEHEALKLIASTNGKDYVRFNLRDQSIDGQISTPLLMAAWNESEKHITQKPNCMFGKIMGFIKARPADCRNYIEWCEFAASWLGLSRNQVRIWMTKEPKIWETSPDSEPAYILGFIANRFNLLDVANKFQKTGNFNVYDERGSAASLISEKLPKRMKEFLLSNIR
jgi:hypothetical protein